MTDEQIIEGVRAGQDRLFGELVHRYQDPVYAMALRMVGGPHDAEDIAQEAFLRVHRGLEGFRGNAKFSTWLYRITCNLCTDWLRKNRRRRTAALEDAGELADTGPETEPGLLQREDRRLLREALDVLQERYRSIVVLHYWQGMPYQQIAEVMGMPVKTVETRLYRARRLLREHLEKGGEGGSG
jgi:RNA polymerase sigma factor (sigma-70 family)